MLLEPQETQSLLEPLGVFSQSGSFSPSPGSSEGPGVEDVLVMDGIGGLTVNSLKTACRFRLPLYPQNYHRAWHIGEAQLIFI